MKISFGLLISFSVLLGHNLVPHHHHAEVVERAIDDHCPVKHNDHQADEDAPRHCHAFNAVSFYKNSSKTIQHKVTPGMVILFSEIVKEDPFASVTCRIINSTVPIELSGHFGSGSTRGPPQFM